MSTSFVIEAHELSKTYKNVRALRSLNLKVQQNSIFGFLGPNGAGKTTTIKLMLGLIRPTGGSATVFGMDTLMPFGSVTRRRLTMRDYDRENHPVSTRDQPGRIPCFSEFPTEPADAPRPNIKAGPVVPATRAATARFAA